MFGSRTLLEHLLRGIAGIGILMIADAIAATYPAIWLLALPLVVFAFRGCPICWTVGLAETVMATVRGRSTNGVECPRCGPTSARPGDSTDGG